jgi:hypothetical protein
MAKQSQGVLGPFEEGNLSSSVWVIRPRAELTCEEKSGA